RVFGIDLESLPGKISVENFPSPRFRKLRCSNVLDPFTHSISHLPCWLGWLGSCSVPSRSFNAQISKIGLPHSNGSACRARLGQESDRCCKLVRPRIPRRTSG